MSAATLQENEVLFKLNTPTRESSSQICCILSKPEGEPTLRAAIIMHGMGSHKNSIFIPKLARKLSREENMYVVRFDFRNCGDSTKTGSDGRTLQNDIEDIAVIYDYLSNGGFQGKKLFVDTLIGHSRGVVDVFNWQLQNQDKFVPNLGACAGRFIGSGLTDNIKRAHPDFEKVGGHYIKGFQDGRYTDVWIPKIESSSLGELYMDKVKDITFDSDTLCLYGSRENVIPLEDAAMYVNALKGRNTFVIIPNADHCFFGVDKVPESEWETSAKPIKNGVVDYNFEVADKLSEWVSARAMQERFYEKTKYIHRFLPRWKSIGNANIRDIGGFNTISGNVVKFDFIFRSDDLSKVSESQLHTLGIGKVFDLTIEGNTTFPSFSSESLIKGEFSPTLFTNNKTLKEDYVSILPKLLQLCKPLFDHIIDVQTPVLYYCSNGRDISGLLTLFLLRVAGVDPLIAAQEYALSKPGDDSHAAYSDVLPVLNTLRNDAAVTETLLKTVALTTERQSALRAALLR